MKKHPVTLASKERQELRRMFTLGKGNVRMLERPDAAEGRQDTGMLGPEPALPSPAMRRTSMNRLTEMLVALLTCASTALAAAPTSQPAVINNPRLSTNRSVDTSTVDRILAGLVRGNMSDEQKCLAVFNWIRTVIYHGDGPADLAYDFDVMVHTLGSGSCLRQTTPLAMLLGKMGYECRSWTHDGHHMLEVKYAGRWHCMDPHMCFYVYDRSEPRTLASVEQLRSDATLAGDAVKENRACPGFLQCGDKPDVFGPGGEWILDDSWPKMKIDEPFGRITLRRGETYCRTWMPGEEKYRFLKAWQFAYGPYHTCCLKADRKDSVNWPLYEPHVAAVGKDGGYKSARHWAAGRLVYKPDLHTDHYADAVVRSSNVTHDEAKGLVAADPRQPAEIVFSVNCPYVMTAGELSLQTAAGATITAAVSTNEGKSWQPVELARDKTRLLAIFVDPINGSFRGYQLRLRLEDGAAIESLELTSHFELNPYALPYLVPGKNIVSLDAERLGSPLKVDWTYAEGPDWKAEKTASRTFAKPGTLTVDIQGAKYPRNVSLTLQVAP
jgi:hypothetical protein